MHGQFGNLATRSQLRPGQQHLRWLQSSQTARWLSMGSTDVLVCLGSSAQQNSISSAHQDEQEVYGVGLSGEKPLLRDAGHVRPSRSRRAGVSVPPLLRETFID